MAHMHQRQQSLSFQLQQQQHLQQLEMQARASPRLQDVSEAHEEEPLSKSPSKTPEARQIKHNPSASLQKEIDDAEYHLEEQFQRQLEHDDYSPHSENDTAQLKESVPAHSRNVSFVNKPSSLNNPRFAAGGDGPILHHPQPHSRGHSLSQAPFPDSEESSVESKLGLSHTGVENSDADMKSRVKSINGKLSHSRSLSIVSNPWEESDASRRTQDQQNKRPGHVSKPSLSGLNVAAKEFKFNPASTFSPGGQFTFGSQDFNPTAISAFPSFAPTQSTHSHMIRPSISTSQSKINVSAPVFTPGNSEFKFSSSGPSFRPDAPAFTPSFSNNFSGSVGSTGSASEDPLRTSIFGNIDLGALGISKPPKKNKAVPIVRPDSSHSRTFEDDNMEDGDGRLVQNSDRIKRARGDKADGDSVPLFSEPSMPLGETSREQSPPKESVHVQHTQANKENLNDGGKTSATTPQFEVSPLSANNDFAPWEFKQQKQAEDFNAARPYATNGAIGLLDEFFEEEPKQPIKVEEPKKSHKKNSLSATAKPFEFRPGAFSFTFGEPDEAAAVPDSKPAVTGLGASRWAKEPTPEKDEEVAQIDEFLREKTASPVPEPTRTAPKPIFGLSGSRFARSPTPEQQEESPIIDLHPEERHNFQAALPQPQSPPTYQERSPTPDRENLPLEDIDAIMNQLNAQDRQRAFDSSPKHRQASPTRMQMPTLDNSSPIRLQPQNLMRSDAPSPSPGRYAFGQYGQDAGHNDVFLGEGTHRGLDYGSPVHRLNNGSSVPASDWDDVLSEAEEHKFQHRAQFFDNHVNELVGGLLEDRLHPVERSLEAIHLALSNINPRALSSRRERRSVSGALSDADDEDDEDMPRRSHSPRRDKKMEKIRNIITETLNAHQHPPKTADSGVIVNDSKEVLQALQEMKEHFGASMRLDFRAEDLRNVVEEAVEKRMTSPKPAVDEAALAREAQQQARIEELELRLAKADSLTEEELKNRRAAEDRLAEVQRLLRISSEEEDRLREVLDKKEIDMQKSLEDRDIKVKSAEDSRSKTAMRVALLEAAHENTKKTVVDSESRLSRAEQQLNDSKQQTQHWRLEAERALESASRHSDDAEQANETNKELRRNLDSLKTQMEESIRVREAMRTKLIALQEDMTSAVRNVAEENARHLKKEQELIARQEVLDARLQAEARTRERLEQEIERLENGERDGMRAVSECKRLEALVSDLKNELHTSDMDAMRYQRSLEEARESGLEEVQRTRKYLQAEVDSANNQVNVVRDDLENQILILRNQLDQVKLDADATQARNEMLLEEAQTSKTGAVQEIARKHADELEDIQVRHERQLGNATEDAQRSEQHLLERLSLSSAKTEHLQDRVAHLEEKLEIANQAATAAAQAAKTARSGSITSQPVRKLSRAAELPEKISPQALRESIMVLQEQLQDREQTIETLEHQVAELDPDAVTKIAKRDDEIIWLRELLAVRKGDLTDIVQALEGDQWDGERVKDAAIRLRASLQMEEQEHERAMNGGSAINLPNIAASLRDAASPRVAQAVGPLAAAWGNWRKSREHGGSFSGPSGTDRSRSSTPSRSNLSNQSSSQSFLSGLMTPPTSSARTPTGNNISTSSLNRRSSNQSSLNQPTAFGNTGQRFTKEQLANRPAPMNRNANPKGKDVARSPRHVELPRTPPMMRKASYDEDAAAGDFSDAGFYDDDESTMDGYGGR